ncbi:MAG: acetylxylan esterase [Planctomycetes bacterium]|nr:acetylxylan esterase [Planctomycetota bacterium]
MPAVLPKPEPNAFANLMRAEARVLRAKDQPPRTRQEWDQRRAALRTAMFEAMGTFPDKSHPLQARVTGVLRRDGYRIEKVVLQTRPGVYMTSSLYLPEPTRGPYPAVLVVHGHWPGARRDPVVQARCLGLVKLGFVVLAVDAFGAGERYTAPALGTYHGALFGSTLWPVGQTLLGMQVYDNRRAVDYLTSRPEVDGKRLGITGASGGGNQTMYAGALDERFGAVVPVCSVGTYQAYLQAACCVCEVLPGALRFCEEGDVLALVAPRALLVVNATRDAFQFSVGEAARSIKRARPVFQLLDAEPKLRHATFESPHAYNQAMRETMYGWMTRWLKNEGQGKPIAEPAHQVEKVEDLTCLPVGKRPAGFLFPATFAAAEARRLLAANKAPDHLERWQATAAVKRSQLVRQIFGEFPRARLPEARTGKASTQGEVRTLPLVLHPEPAMPVPVLLQTRGKGKEPRPACLMLHIEGKDEALRHPLAAAFLERGWAVAAADLRATGETRSASDGQGIAGAPDHNSAEHALWVGRPLLGQWVFDARSFLEWLGRQKTLNPRRLTVVGIGQAALIAACVTGVEEHVAGLVLIDAPATIITETPYPSGTHMGMLAPALLRVGDVPQLAALTGPRKLVIAGGKDASGKPLADKDLQTAYRFTRDIYRLQRVEQSLSMRPRLAAGDIAALLE